MLDNSILECYCFNSHKPLNSLKMGTSIHTDTTTTKEMLRQTATKIEKAVRKLGEADKSKEEYLSALYIISEKSKISILRLDQIYKSQRYSNRGLKDEVLKHKAELDLALEQLKPVFRGNEISEDYIKALIFISGETGFSEGFLDKNLRNLDFVDESVVDLADQVVSKNLENQKLSDSLELLHELLLKHPREINTLPKSLRTFRKPFEQFKIKVFRLSVNDTFYSLELSKFRDLLLK